MDAKLVFCIDCQEVVEMESGPLSGHILYVPVRDDNGYVMGVDVDFCDMIGGYTFSPPPAVDPNWVEHVVEIGDEFVVDDQIDIYKGSYYFDPELPEEVAYIL